MTTFNERLRSLRLGQLSDVVNDSENPEDHLSDLRFRLMGDVIGKFDTQRLGSGEDSAEITADEIRLVASRSLGTLGVPLASKEREDLLQSLTDEMLGYGPLQDLVDDDEVSEIMVNGPHEVYVERAGRIDESGVTFVDDAHLMRIIDRIVSQVGRRIDESSPMVDARLPDGSRVNAIIPPLSLTGPCLTIRKFRRDPLVMADLINLGTITPRAAMFLDQCVTGGANILISGGTGTGKTTTLNVLSSAIPETERIVTIEDAAELQMHQKHVIRLESRPPNLEGNGRVTIRDLVRNSLRMRPDRIIVGEVRSNETVDMLQAMNTGHDGCLTTVHANGPREAMSRLETLVLTAGVEIPVTALREQISSAFDLIVQLTRMVDGSRRITHISEVVGMESDVITLQDLFVSKLVSGHETGHGMPSARAVLGPLSPTGVVPRFLDKLECNNVHVPHEVFVTEVTQERPNRKTTTLRARITEG